MKTFKLTTNNADKIEDLLYEIVREDGLILYANPVYDNAEKVFKDLAFHYMMRGELINMIIE